MLRTLIFFLKGQQKLHDKMIFKQKLEGSGVSEGKVVGGEIRGTGRGA